MHQIESFTFLCQYIILVQIALSLYRGLFSTRVCQWYIWNYHLSTEKIFQN